MSKNLLGINNPPDISSKTEINERDIWDILDNYFNNTNIFLTTNQLDSYNTFISEQIPKTIRQFKGFDRCVHRCFRKWFQMIRLFKNSRIPTNVEIPASVVPGILGAPRSLQTPPLGSEGGWERRTADHVCVHHVGLPRIWRVAQSLFAPLPPEHHARQCPPGPRIHLSHCLLERCGTLFTLLCVWCLGFVLF